MRAGSRTSTGTCYDDTATRTGPGRRVDGGEPVGGEVDRAAGIRRRRRERASRRPSWRTSRAAGRLNCAVRSMKRPSGAGKPGLTAFGEIHSSGAATSTGLGRSPASRSDRSRSGGRHARPDSAAMSAVSAACTRLPAANTPSADVARAVSTAGPRFRRRSRARPSAPGVIGDPVAGEDDQLAGNVARVPVLRSSAISTPAAARRGRRSWSRRPTSRPGAPAQRRARPEGGVALVPLEVGHQRDHVAPAWASVTAAENATCSAPTTSARPEGARRPGRPVAGARPWS